MPPMDATINSDLAAPRAFGWPVTCPRNITATHAGISLEECATSTSSEDFGAAKKRMRAESETPKGAASASAMSTIIWTGRCRFLLVVSLGFILFSLGGAAHVNSKRVVRASRDRIEWMDRI